MKSLRKSLEKRGALLLAGLAAAPIFIPTGGAIARQLTSPPPQEHAATLSYKRDIDFDNFKLREIPDGFAPVVSGAGKEALWTVTLEPSAPSGTNVLAQTSSEEIASRFPILLYDKLVARNVDVAVQFKTLSGKLDQAAGLIVRFQDENHFYAVRANAFENRINLYKVTNGARQSIAERKAPVSSDEWHTLRVVAHDARFAVFFDDQLFLEAEDASSQAAGKIGLSTKADSVTVFDNLHIAVHDR